MYEHCKSSLLVAALPTILGPELMADTLWKRRQGKVAKVTACLVANGYIVKGSD